MLGLLLKNHPFTLLAVLWRKSAANRWRYDLRRASRLLSTASATCWHSAFVMNSAVGSTANALVAAGRPEEAGSTSASSDSHVASASVAFSVNKRGAASYDQDFKQQCHEVPFVCTALSFLSTNSPTPNPLPTLTFRFFSFFCDASSSPSPAFPALPTSPPSSSPSV